MADFRDYVGLDFTSYLSHYGKGHLDGGHSGRYPWGSTNNVKRSPGVARENTKFLNRSEKRLAKDVSKQLQYQRKFRKLVRKQNKKLDKLIKHKNAAPIKNKKVQKLEGKLDELEYKMALQQDSIDVTKELINSTIKKLSESGYDVQVEQKQYDVAFGKYLVSQFLLGPAGTAVLSAVIKPDEQFIDGNKWKVSVPDSKAIPTATTSATLKAKSVTDRLEDARDTNYDKAKEYNSLARDLRYLWDADELKKRKY